MNQIGDSAGELSRSLAKVKDFSRSLSICRPALQSLEVCKQAEVVNCADQLEKGMNYRKTPHQAGRLPSLLVDRLMLGAIKVFSR